MNNHHRLFFFWSRLWAVSGQQENYFLGENDPFFTSYPLFLISQQQLSQLRSLACVCGFHWGIVPLRLRMALMRSSFIPLWDPIISPLSRLWWVTMFHYQEKAQQRGLFHICHLVWVFMVAAAHTSGKWRLTISNGQTLPSTGGQPTVHTCKDQTTVDNEHFIWKKLIVGKRICF